MLFGATNIVKTSDKQKYVYSGNGITFNCAGSRSFDNDFARNVIFFYVNNSSSFNSDHRKNIFSVLGEGSTYGINGSFGAPEIKFTIDFTEKSRKSCSSLNYNADIVIYFLM